MTEFEKQLKRATEIRQFYKLAAKNGFTKGNDYACIECDQWIEGPYADCSKCSDTPV